MPTRYAKVGIPNGKKALDHCDTIANYLPSGYKVMAIVISDPNYILVAGEDYAGWTMDDYVIPRLQSGLIFAQEMSREEVLRLPL